MRGRNEAQTRPTLVVGAGLTGAALAFLAARAGEPTYLVSVDRPASQATALARGVVHGVGPPVDPYTWSRLPAEVHASSAARCRNGYDLLRHVLLSARRPAGLTRMVHELRPPVTADGSWLERTVALLRGVRWPVVVEDRSGGPVLVRNPDAVADPRRLTFELLSQARRHGARVRLGVAFRGIQHWAEDHLRVRLSESSIEVSRLLWATGRPIPEAPVTQPARSKLVLHQVLAAGARPLRAILELGEGDLTLFPDPLRAGRVVLVRRAEERPSGGLSWPELPREWEAFRGPALRQRLAEANSAPLDRTFVRLGPLVAMSGLSGWPVSAVLGSCLEAWASTY